MRTLIKLRTSLDLVKSNYLLFGILSVLLSSALLLSCIIPPFQSPDEFEHIKRAYLLTSGKVILKPVGELSTGGSINSGLLDFMKQYEQFPFNPEQKISKATLNSASTIQWTNLEEFSPVYSISSYFPGLYTPQALGLFIGKKFNLSILKSYQIAKSITVISIFLMIAISCILFRPSAFVLAILCTPMSLYQLASPSLDGIATATFILIISIFLRLVTTNPKGSTGLLLVMGLFSFLLTSARIHTVPILLFFICGYYLTKNKKYLAIAFIATVATAIWILISIKTTVDRRVINTFSSAEILDFYLHNLSSFFHLVISTVSNPAYFNFYVRSALGNLGWADWPQGQFSTTIYSFIIFFLIVIAFASTTFSQLKRMRALRFLFLICALGSSLIVFFALLIGWTTHPATYIEGVQGRYFHIPLLLIGYALCPYQIEADTIKERLSYMAIYPYLLFMACITASVVMSRYYTG